MTAEPTPGTAPAMGRTRAWLPRGRGRHAGAPVLAVVAVIAALLVLYGRTLSPGILGGDAGELQFVPAILGLPHPTGTPLYVLLGHLWGRLPLGGDVAWRLNLLAAVSASLAGGVIVLALQRLTGRVLPAIVAALVFCLGGTFWPLATQADKYAFNALMLASVLAVALRWGATREPRTLRALALVYGLSLTHHRTMVLLAPPVLGYVWALEGRALWMRRRRLAGLAALLCAPLLLYLYLPWAEARGLPPGSWHPQGLGDWLAYLADIGYVSQVATGVAGLGAQLLGYLQTLVADMTIPGVALGLVGLVTLLVRQRADGLLLLGAYVLLAVGGARYQVPRHEVFFTPSFLIYALWIGVGLAAVADAADCWLSRRALARPGLWVSGALLLLLAALLLWPAVARYRPLREAHHGAGVLDIWRQELKSGGGAGRLGHALALVPPQAIIVCDWEQATPLWVVQQVLSQRPDVSVLYPVERLDEALASGRPVVLARHLDSVPMELHPGALGPLVGLHTAPQRTLPDVAVPLHGSMGDGIGLAGYALDASVAPAGTVVPVTVYWRADRAPERDWSVSVRLYDPAGRQVAQADNAHPVLGLYATSRWDAGEVVADYYELQVPPRAAPGAYRWEVILYRALAAGGWETLPAEGPPPGGTLEVVGR